MQSQHFQEHAIRPEIDSFHPNVRPPPVPESERSRNTDIHRQNGRSPILRTSYCSRLCRTSGSVACSTRAATFRPTCSLRPTLRVRSNAAAMLPGQNSSAHPQQPVHLDIQRYRKCGQLKIADPTITELNFCDCSSINGHAQRRHSSGQLILGQTVCGMIASFPQPIGNNVFRFRRRIQPPIL